LDFLDQQGVSSLNYPVGVGVGLSIPTLMNASSTPFTKAGGKPSLPKTKDTITTVEPNNYKQISSGAMGLIIGKIIMTLCILFAVK